jgi:hypothetical protein
MNRKLLIVVASVLAISVLAVYFLFLADKTPPNAPTLASPTDSFVVERAPGYSLSFFWYEPEQELAYDLQVAANAQFTNVILTKTKLPPASYGIQFAEIGAIIDGTHYWRVRAIDKAGNVGPWSEIGTFVVKTRAS